MKMEHAVADLSGRRVAGSVKAFTVVHRKRSGPKAPRYT